MNALLIAPTEDTPKVILNPENGIFQISERSLPENAVEFYQPIIDWLDTAYDQEKIIPEFNFNLEYFNIASAKQIAKVLMVLKKHDNIKKLKIRWFYEKVDRDMYSAGTRFQKLLNLDFEFIEK